MASDRVLRWLCWGLIGFTIVSAVFTVTLTNNPFATPVPEGTDFVNTLLSYRADDQRIYGIVLVGSLAGLGVFAIAAALGPVLRRFAMSGPGADAMAAVFILGGSVGVISQLVNIGAAQAATYTYCDCSYLAEEVIAQDYALAVSWALQEWLNIGAIAIVGVAAALAGAVVKVSMVWSRLSYLIAVALMVAVGMRVFDMAELSNLLVGVVAGLLVPIWAFMLARGIESESGPGQAEPELEPVVA